MADFLDAGYFRALGCRISAVDIVAACQQVDARVSEKLGGHVCFVNTHTCVTAKHDARLLNAINGAAFALPDGKPIAMVGSLRGHKNVERVGGPDFMFEYFRAGYGRRHFLLGSTQDTLDALVVNLRRQFPGEEIVGAFSPPFGPFSYELDSQIARLVRETDAEIVWVGLGAPKQEYWIADHSQSLSPALLMGVGAAFDFHAGKISRAPKWMQRAGLEWFHRLSQEPRRLWKRYLVTNTQFLVYMVVDFIRGALAGSLK